MPFILPTTRGLPAEGLQRVDWVEDNHRNPELLWLDKNENTDPILRDLIYKVLAEMDPRCVMVYPDTAPLYHKLAEYHNVSTRSLVLAQGSDGVIGAMFRAFIEPGDSVMITRPTYAMYEMYARMHGANVHRLDYSLGESGLSLDIDSIAGMIKSIRPKLVCLANPDSPTGTVIEPDVLRDIIAGAMDAGTMVLIDEAYYPFYPYTTVPWIEEFPNLVVARTFSKAWGLTGLRVGYGLASRDVVTILQNFRPNYQANTMAVAIVQKMLSEYENEMKASVKRLNAGRDKFLSAMKSLGFRVLECHGNFCHVAFGQRAESVHAALSNMVLYRKEFSSACLNEFSRFTSTTEELYGPVIKRISDVVMEA